MKDLGKELSDESNTRGVALFDRGDGSWIARFRNGEEVTHLRLSTFAVDALVSLYLMANGANAVIAEEGGLQFARASK